MKAESARTHWRQRATYTYDPHLLGEDENGDLWVPARGRPGWWDRRFSPWRPTHWPTWLRSRWRKAISFIEVEETTR